MLAVGLLANCPRGALSSTPSPQGGCECNWGTPEEPDVRDRATSCPIFSQFWEELGRTEVRGREDLDMARKPLSTAFGAWTSEFHRGDFYPPVRTLHVGAESPSQQDTQ